jgi:hypothetical protein
MGGAAQPGDLDRRISALGALYQADKADAASNFNVSMAMMGIGAAYIIGALGYSDKFGSGPLSWTLVMFGAVPLWLIAAFHSLLALNGMMHGLSVQILEDELFFHTNLPTEARGYTGSRGGDSIMDITKSRMAHKWATAFVYGGVALLVLGFTIYVAIESWSQVSVPVRWFAVVIYTASAATVIFSWSVGFSVLGQGGDVKDSMGTVPRADH